MNFEVWPQKSRTTPASRPHQRPRHRGEERLRREGGGVSVLPCKNSQSILKVCRVFIFYPRNKRRKKKTAVGRSIQKNAQPRFTRINVSSQLATFPRSGALGTAPPASSESGISIQWRCLQLDQSRWPASSSPCQSPHPMKLRPAPGHNPLRNIVMSTFK